MFLEDQSLYVLLIISLQHYYLVHMISNLKDPLQIKDVCDYHTLERKKCRWFVMNTGETN